MTRATAVRSVLLAALLSLAVGAGAARVARADDDPAEARAIAADLERLRNNPFFDDKSDRVRDLVERLLARRSARADSALRELLLDPRTDAVIVEQTACLTVLASPHRLLDDVVDRLRRDPPGSPLDRRVAGPLLHADADVVRRLAELSQDAARTPAYRATAIRLLGGTGDAGALAPLAELWAGPDRELRDAARLAFDDVAPGAAATVEEARTFVETLRRDDVPLSEALRRMLRERMTSPLPSSGAADGVTLRDYTELAMSMLPKATLDQILRLYLLASPVPEVRAAAVARLAAYPYDAEPDPDGRVRTAHALFAALRREDSGTVENAILTTLATLAPAIRGGVAPEDMEALLVRVRPGGAVARETRLLATRLAGQLRDERAAEPLESTYVWFGDADEEARIVILDALQDVPADRTAWLVERTVAERQPRVLRKLVRMLSRSQAPSAVGAFAALLGDPGRADAETRVEAAKALATQWAVRSDPAARDALLERGLSDPDPSVRSSSAGALGIDGPDRARTTAGLLRVVRSDLDADVRRTAARSVILIDGERATANLIGRFADDPAVFEVWRGHIVDGVRRDQAPDGALAAADALVAAGLRPHAVSLLEVTADGAPDLPRGRARVREALTRLLLDEGLWQDAERSARALVSGEPKDDAARDRYDVLVARALTASGESDRLADAERRLVGLRAAGRLDRASDAEAAATLGDCRLRRGDVIGAVEALSVDPKDATESVRRRLAQLVADAERSAALERATVFAFVEQIGGPDDAAAREKLSSPDYAGTVAWHLGRELAATTDFATVRRLLSAAEIVTGGPMPRLADDASPSQKAEAVAAARSSLAKVTRRAVSGSR